MLEINKVHEEFSNVDTKKEKEAEAETPPARRRDHFTGSVIGDLLEETWDELGIFPFSLRQLIFGMKMFLYFIIGYRIFLFTVWAFKKVRGKTSNKPITASISKGATSVKKKLGTPAPNITSPVPVATLATPAAVPLAPAVAPVAPTV